MKQFLNALLIMAFIALPGSVGAAGLDSVETEDLLYMREEEKLARDVYLSMDALWHRRVFQNIALSEQRHMDAMLRMLNLFGIPDPAAGNDLGEFTNPELQDLFDVLWDQGTASLLDAYYVGALIEERDIRDINVAMDNTDEPRLLESYGNLLMGSCNHLWAFTRHIESLGIDYEWKILDEEQAEAVCGSSDDSAGPKNSEQNARSKRKGKQKAKIKGCP